jgi:hypothetical protein
LETDLFSRLILYWTILTQAAHDAAVRYLYEELTATETIFPGTDLRLVYKLGSG